MKLLKMYYKKIIQKLHALFCKINFFQDNYYILIFVFKWKYYNHLFLRYLKNKKGKKLIEILNSI